MNESAFTYIKKRIAHNFKQLTHLYQQVHAITFTTYKRWWMNWMVLVLLTSVQVNLKTWNIWMVTLLKKNCLNTVAPSLQNLLHNNATLQNHRKLQWIFSMLHLLHQGIENGNGLVWIFQAPWHPCWNIICDCSVNNFIYNMLPEEVESFVKNVRQLKY